MIAANTDRLKVKRFDVTGPRSHACLDLQRVLRARKRPLPKCLMVVLENLLRQQLKGADVSTQIDALVNLGADSGEIICSLKANRVLFPDSSGLPALMDLAAARDAMAASGLAPELIEPVVPVTLVVDHSLIVDHSGRIDAPALNEAKEMERNAERYAFFKWAEAAFDNLTIVPPGSGIIHQVHLEKLARLVALDDQAPGQPLAFPEFVLGCDSHTTMINSIGLLGWGVGGIDGEMAMLGNAYSVRIPRVIGVRLTGALQAGIMPTDLVLTITNRLRDYGVVGAFVEFFGSGLEALSVADRATIANMAPEYGATIGFFPIDNNTIDYLQQSGRSKEHIALVEAYAKASSLFADADEEADYSDILEIDLASIRPSVSGPKRPQDLVALDALAHSFRETLSTDTQNGGFGLPPHALENKATITLAGKDHTLTHGSIVIAAITSCTNTSNPTVMIGAGLLARNARRLGLTVPAFVKTSMAPGSKLVRDYLQDADLMGPLQELGFHIVGYGCTTCSGKSGPINPVVADAISDQDLVAAAVLSGNRNFEGRIHKSCRASYLASPVLIVAFALAGRVDIDFDAEPLGFDPDNGPVFLKDIWPDRDEILSLVGTSQTPARFNASYASLYQGSKLWRDLESPSGQQFAWDTHSSYIKRPPFFDLPATDLPDELSNARVLVMAGDSLTTDHVTPSGEILSDSLAGRYLMDSGVAPSDFNAVTQRRGNHDFMTRITFGNQRMKNRLVPGVEGGFTRLTSDGDVLPIFDAAQWLTDNHKNPIVLAGRDYGMGSSRDWAAKGPKLLGVRLVLAQSFERIHRANLIGMGIIPLVFVEGQSIDSLGLTGFETFSFAGLSQALEGGQSVVVTAKDASGKDTVFDAQLDVSGMQETELLRQGGIFQSLIANAKGKNRIKEMTE
ncbi:aconitate hydratase AcnA [Pararhizobium sp. IMCC21322]|uniref:aconitate hydratase AcnA n=1 Tax=Pararhizobium sp. IMCC21322 TaxID=3067903 RepID=UPI002741A91A|nr:aconitate hydratase AcnA [Pararhizobium sp. IMCC21322]